MSEVAGGAVGQQGHGDSLDTGRKSIRNLRGQERELPRAFSGVADVEFAVESGVFVGMRGAGDSGCSGEGSVVRLIILWILSRVRTLVGGVWKVR